MIPNQIYESNFKSSTVWASLTLLWKPLSANVSYRSKVGGAEGGGYFNRHTHAKKSMGCDFWVFFIGEVWQALKKFYRKTSLQLGNNMGSI